MCEVCNLDLSVVNSRRTPPLVIGFFLNSLMDKSELNYAAAPVEHSPVLSVINQRPATSNQNDLASLE